MSEVFELAAFYEAIADDARIGTSHISLYIALLNEKNTLLVDGFMEIRRDALMKNARISRKTYNKCMKELQEYGYIKYQPSSNPMFGSKVLLKRL